jgi:hypothetical protein
VTHIEASWTERERRDDGDFTHEFILGNGVEEYILRPWEDDTDVLLTLFHTSDHTTFDLDRKVLMLSNLRIG